MTLDEQKTEVLRLVRKDIECGRQTYICHSLEAVQPLRLRPAANALRLYVQKQLGGAEFSLWDWLVCEGHVTEDMCHTSWPLQHSTRLAWIDWMIEQLKESV